MISVNPLHFFHIIFFFFFNDTATTEIYTLSLHDVLPISSARRTLRGTTVSNTLAPKCALRSEEHTSELQSLTNLVCRLLLEKKKSTRLNSSHCRISYAVFCLKRRRACF